MSRRAIGLWAGALLTLFALTAIAHAAIIACHAEQSYDNAVAVQFMHLAFNGWGESGVVGASAFGDHFNPLFLLPAPLFAIWPSALTLQLFKSAVYLGMLVPLALLARDLLGKRSGAWVAVIVVLSPMLWVSLFADYHSETLAAGFIPWMLLAYERKRLGLCLLAAAAVALGKENLSLVVGGLGVLALVEKRDMRWVASLGLLGGVVFVLGVFIIIPGNAQVEGRAIGDLLFSRLGTAQGWGEALGDPSLYRWLGFLLLSCGGLCLLAPRKLWPLVPLLLQHGLADRPEERIVDFHYLAPVLPLLAYAALHGATRLGHTPVVVAARRQVAVGGLLAINLLLLVSIGFHHDPRSDRFPGPFARLLRLSTQHGVEDLAARIPENAPAWASISTASRIANRDRLYMVEAATRRMYLTRTWPFDPSVAGDVGHGLVDVRDAYVPGSLVDEAIDAVGDVVLLARGEPLVQPSPATDFARWPGANNVRIGQGHGGAYQVVIEPLGPGIRGLVLLQLMRDGRVVDKRAHRLLYGRAESAWFGVYRTRYRHPYVLANPGSYQLFVRLPGNRTPILLTTYE